MATGKHFKKLKIFVASPMDVEAERTRLAAVVESLNRGLADHLGLVLELIEWKQVVPGMGVPEDVILDQLPIEAWDIFIGILWLRFGTPTGNVDHSSGKPYESGTEEEFKLAYNLWKKEQRPRIIIYRCIRPPATMIGFNSKQFNLVEKFFKQFESRKGINTGLYRTFETADDFERLVRDHLDRFLIQYNEEVEHKSIAADIVRTFAPTYPNTLPRRTPFFGRKEEMVSALRALDREDRGWGLVIDGIGGIGKTALAIEVAYISKERNTFDAFIFVSAKKEGLDANGIQEANFANYTLDGLINEVARALNQPGVIQLTESNEKQRVLLDALRSQRALLIFDNLETLTIKEQSVISDFLRNLPQDCKAIITSRRRTGESALTLRLERLKWEEAREIISDQLKRHPRITPKLIKGKETQWKRLYDETGGSPLALMWIIGLIATRSLSIDRAIELLSSSGVESDLNQFLYREARKTMDPNERLALGALSFFGDSASPEALAIAANLDRRALGSVLERLCAMSLVDLAEVGHGDEGGEERYTLHPLTRRFARMDLAQHEDTEGKVGHSYSRYWVDYAVQNSDGEEKADSNRFRKLELEWPNLLSAARWLYEASLSGTNTVIDEAAAENLNILVGAVERFMWICGHWDKYIELNRWAYESAAALRDWDKAGDFAYNVAFNYYTRAVFNKAGDWINNAEKAWTRASTEIHKAVIKQMRGNLAKRRDEFELAEQLLQGAISIWRKLELDSNLAVALKDLGDLFIKRKDYSEAAKYYGQALELAQLLDHKEGVCNYMCGFGDLEFEKEEWVKARGWFEDALDLARELGLVNMVAVTQYSLARTWKALGRNDLALALAQDSLIIFQRLQYVNVAEVKSFIKECNHE